MHVLTLSLVALREGVTYSRARRLGWRLPVIALAVFALGPASFVAGIAVRGAFAQPGTNTLYACVGERSGPAPTLVDITFSYWCVDASG